MTLVLREAGNNESSDLDSRVSIDFQRDHSTDYMHDSIRVVHYEVCHSSVLNLLPIKKIITI